MLNKKNGFTLIELMVAITIIATMAGIAIIGLPNVTKRGNDVQKLAGFRELQLALEAYRNINGKYPDPGNSPIDYISGLSPAFIQRLPQDIVQNGLNGFIYKRSQDSKSYCLMIVGTIYRPESQQDLTSDCEKTWISCKGNDTGDISSCDFNSENGSTNLDNY